MNDQPSIRAQPFPGWRAAALVFTLLHVALLASRTLYPFIDLPFHLTAATALRQAAAGGGALAAHYTCDLALKPNVAHLLFASLFPAAEWSNRIFYGLYAALLPLATWLLIRRLGGDPAFALLAFPLLYSFSVLWGFAGYTLGLPLVLLFLAGLYSELTAPGLGKEIGLCLLLVLIFLTHALPVLFLSLVLLLCAAAGWRRPWPARRRWLWIPLPAWLLLAAWWTQTSATGEAVGSVSTLEHLWLYYSRELFSLETVWTRCKDLFGQNLYLTDGAGRLFFSILFSAAALTPLVLAAGPWGAHLRALLRKPAGRFAGLFLAAAFGCALLLPPGLPGQWAIYQRFPILALLAAVVTAALLPWRWTTPRRLALGVVLLLHLGLYADYFIDFEHRNRGFRPDLFAGLAPEDRLGGLIYDREYRGRPVYVHFADYYTVWHGGPAVSSAGRFRFGAVRLRPEVTELPAPILWLDPNTTYDGQFQDLEALLVRGEVPPEDHEWLEGFELLRTRGAWALYRNRAAAIEAR